MALNVDLFGNPIESELPIAGDSKPIAGISPPLDSPARPTAQSVSDSDVIFRPFRWRRDGNVTTIWND